MMMNDENSINKSINHIINTETINTNFENSESLLKVI